MQRDINTSDIRKALMLLSQSDLGKKILSECQNANFDTSEIAILPSDGKRAGKCFREVNGEEVKDLVSITENFLQDPVFNEIKTDNEKCEMLANLMAHELTHAAQYGREPALMRIENASEQNEKEKKRNITAADGVQESLIEADCRAVQFMLAAASQSPTILKTLEKMHEPILDKNDYTLWKLRNKLDNKPDIAKKQQAFRKIFENILTSYVSAIEKDQFPKYGVTEKIDFNGYENLIAGVYDEQKYGSPHQFADTIPGLTDEHKTRLVGKILSQKKMMSYQHAIQASSFRETTNKNLSGVKKKEKSHSISS